MKSGIDEDLLMAHLDGELDTLTAGRVAEALAKDPELRALAEEQRRLKHRLADHYGSVIHEEIPSRLRSMLETNVIALPAGAAKRPGLGWPAWGALAASFAIGLVAAEMIPQMIPARIGPAVATGERLVAAGPLARALDTQLASEQSPSQATRIGLSFAAKDGRICRTFENQVMAGLACRDGEGWNLVAHETVRPGPGGEYRQAASGTALVMPISQELMNGEPFDARTERQARDAGWVSRR